MNSDDFERSLQNQPLRKIPTEWRDQILHAANDAAPASVRPSPLVPRPSSWWRALLWPCPQAWVGLAAAWVFIVLINFGSLEKPSPVVAKTPLPSKEILLALREQRRELARAIAGDEPSAEPPRRFVPRPRSEGNRPIAIG